MLMDSGSPFGKVLFCFQGIGEIMYTLLRCMHALAPKFLFNDDQKKEINTKFIMRVGFSLWRATHESMKATVYDITLRN